jgi:competence CoiA-like predicted nuclease
MKYYILGINMQSAFLKGTNQKVFAWEYAKLEGRQFQCTACGAAMYLKNGMVRIAHFAHTPESVCSYAQHESGEKVLYKMSIYDTLSKRYAGTGRQVDLEYTGVIGCRPDVFIHGKRHNIAIEILVDPTDVRKIIIDTETYFEANVGVIWVLPYENVRLHEDRFKMKEHEKLLYFMNNKKLLFWHRREKAFTVAAFVAAYGDSTEFYDKNQGGMVYFEGKKLRSTFEIKNLIDEIYPEDLERWYSPKRFEMKSYKYPLPKSILWKYKR